jgi:membrane dipeptidase
VSDAIPLAAQVGRVPSMRVPLDAAQEQRFARLMDDLVLVDMHQHPMVLPDDPLQFGDYFRGNAFVWGYQAVRHGGWTAVATANIFSCMGKEPEASYARFGDLVDEVGLMLADLSCHADEVRLVRRADDVLSARQAGQVGWLPTLEHLAIGDQPHRVDVLYGLGVRLAGLTYTRKSPLGDGQYERTDCGLSELGVEVVRRMNARGMAIDLSHAGAATAQEAIALSEAPVIFSHNAAHTLRPTRRSRWDADFTACAARGGLVCVTAVPNSLSDDPRQDINCVLDHYDYLVRLVGVDHVGIGTDTLIGDHVGFHRVMLGRDAPNELPAPYLDGLESPADGSNIIRGLLARGYEDNAIRKIAGQNALDFLRRTIS